MEIECKKARECQAKCAKCGKTKEVTIKDFYTFLDQINVSENVGNR